MNVVDNNVVKKTVYDRIVAKINAVDTKMLITSGLLTKKQKKNRVLRKILIMLTKKIPNTSGLVHKVDYITKITEIENQIPIVTGLFTAAVLNTKAT